MLEYDMPLYRPPSEGENLIIQATLGCSFNGCTFCSMYKSKTYRARPLFEVKADIAEARRLWPSASRVFLADGDALTLPTDHLLSLLDELNAAFPELTRVSAYGTPVNLLKKTENELARLKAHKLSLIYFGIESGSADILRRIRKGTTREGMIESLTKARAAGLKVSATVVLGLGGRNRWEEHIDGTIDLVNRAPPNYLSTLQLGLEEHVVERFLEKFGEPFLPQNDAGILLEQERLIAGLNPHSPIIFRSNHASNALALAGNLPKDREKLLNTLREARDGRRSLRPRFLRGL
jgi:coproporphyrinogen III oxidase-like Fe-S oxidoreductase